MTSANWNHKKIKQVLCKIQECFIYSKLVYYDNCLWRSFQRYLSIKYFTNSYQLRAMGLFSLRSNPIKFSSYFYHFGAFILCVCCDDWLMYWTERPQDFYDDQSRAIWVTITFQICLTLYIKSMFYCHFRPGLVHAFYTKKKKNISDILYP